MSGVSKPTISDLVGDVLAAICQHGVEDAGLTEEERQEALHSLSKLMLLAYKGEHSGI